MRRYQGGCHCGAIKVVFESAVEPADLEIRACGCGFCTRHSTRTITDPAGRLVLHAAKDAAVTYRFAMGITDFILCGQCGCYIGALMEDGGERVGIVNSRMLDDRTIFDAPATSRDYSAEDEDGRRARRHATWTPVTWEHDTDTA
ncbi:MAG: aldehyde-activating protein [Alphaproteobacteria bacterium]|jgi:hypothetical protein|nr:aldehyde-activating protein [Rhodospirillaceae bacterium]MDG2480988.1 aldehyde-activating protein [Alphaproteobacteria bacterium]MBT6204954.1 aldehyde-activating protein [Rhodospirillaceae bacterium]MBT6510858.1 aldehyde-activating protein [Rhodospirillaceae bacterium]MBT7612811.1 aldehyde-activating protein [Rhodospirillaceae bacterium]